MIIPPKAYMTVDAFYLKKLMSRISDDHYQSLHRLDSLKFKDVFQKEYKFKFAHSYKHPYDVLLEFESEQDLLHFKLTVL